MNLKRARIQSILEALALAQNASDESLNTEGVSDILADMDEMAAELREVLE